MTIQDMTIDYFPFSIDTSDTISCGSKLRGHFWFREVKSRRESQSIPAAIRKYIIKRHAN